MSFYGWRFGHALWRVWWPLALHQHALRNRSLLQLTESVHPSPTMLSSVRDVVSFASIKAASWRAPSAKPSSRTMFRYTSNLSDLTPCPDSISCVAGFSTAIVVLVPSVFLGSGLKLDSAVTQRGDVEVSDARLEEPRALTSFSCMTLTKRLPEGINIGEKKLVLKACHKTERGLSKLIAEYESHYALTRLLRRVYQSPHSRKPQRFNAPSSFPVSSRLVGV